MSVDVLEEMKTEHADLRLLFSAYTGIGFHDPRRKELVDRATALLLREARVEEACLYPLVRRLPGGEQAVLTGTAENREIEALLSELDHSDQDTPGFDRLVAQLVERATGHANRAEATLFPELRSSLSAEDLARLSEEAAEVRDKAPIKPRQLALALPPDDLPPPELGHRRHGGFSPAGSGRRPAYAADIPPGIQSATEAHEAAEAGRRAGAPGVATAGPNTASPDAVAILLEQHVRVQQLLTRVRTTSGSARREAFRELRELLSAHEAAEQAVLRPVTRRTVGDAVADARTAEERQADQALAELDQLPADSPEFDTAFRAFEQSVLEHARREEKEEFPEVRAQCSAEELVQLGARLVLTERESSDTPAGHRAPGHLAAMAERVRGALKPSHDR